MNKILIFFSLFFMISLNITYNVELNHPLENVIENNNKLVSLAKDEIISIDDDILIDEYQVKTFITWDADYGTQKTEENFVIEDELKETFSEVKAKWFIGPIVIIMLTIFGTLLKRFIKKWRGR